MISIIKYIYHRFVDEWETCPTCLGAGSILDDRGSEYITCPSCGGSGGKWVKVWKDD